MKYTTASVVIAIAFLGAFQAHAQRTGGMYSSGNKNCGDYLEDMKNPTSGDYYAIWTWGFLSAWNTYGTRAQVQGDVSKGTILAYLDKHCRNEPLSFVGSGIAKLAKELGERK